MASNQLIQICQTLSKKEIRDLKKWLQSPAHNQREDVVKVFDYLLQGDHLYQAKYQSKEKIFNKLFPKELYDDARLRQTFHFTLISIEDF
ncbi:MAG: hypothetical protein HRU40_17645, partial [Saprospiraceae bacterium]|nr:hypothetical protein [Saprospiraceae bacterium]